MRPEPSAGTLPNLLIVGAMRSGTTSAYRYLSEHPGVFMSPSKEPHFFAFEGARPTFAGPGDDRLNGRVTVDLAEYRDLFSGATDQPWRGEASAMYLYLPESAEAIRRHCIDPMVVVMLRNPVDRAYSSYQYLRRQGREPVESFAEALAAEPSRVRANWSPMWHYRTAGLYVDQVRTYLEMFGSQRVHVMLYDDFERDARGTFEVLFRGLDLDPEASIDFSLQHNRSGVPRSSVVQRLLSRSGPARRRAKRLLPRSLKRAFEQVRESNVSAAPGIDSTTRARVTEIFAEDIGRLELLIHRDLSSWKLDSTAVR